jgi:hypothetical protein
MPAAFASQRSAVIVGVTALAALALKILIAVRTYGTNDVLSWEQFAWTLRESGGIGLYHEERLFNHPPFMIHALRLLDFVASKTGTPFSFWFRLPAILADAGSTYLVWRILVAGTGVTARPLALVLMAAAPASIMISGFHGNTDAEMMFFVLLSVYLIERPASAWIAGAALGMSLNFKVVPLVFVPAIVLYLPSARKRIAYLVAAGVIVTLGSVPYVLQDPVYIARRILGYRSIYGHWGLGRLLSELPSWSTAANWAYFRFGPYLLLGAIVTVSVVMNRLRAKPPLFLQCGLVAFLFLALAPGFGVQYLAWLVPWVVALGLGATLAYYLASGVFLFVVYTFWSRGFPWHFADAIGVGEWQGWMVSLEVLCWLSVVLITAVYLKVLYRRSPGRSGSVTGSERM